MAMAVVKTSFKQRRAWQKNQRAAYNRIKLMFYFLYLDHALFLRLISDLYKC